MRRKRTTSTSKAAAREIKDLRTRVRELEGILKKIGQGRVQHGSASTDGHALRYGTDFQSAAGCTRFKACAGFCILDERRDGKDLPLRQCSLLESSQMQ